VRGGGEGESSSPPLVSVQKEKRKKNSDHSQVASAKKKGGRKLYHHLRVRYEKGEKFSVLPTGIHSERKGREKTIPPLANYSHHHPQTRKKREKGGKTAGHLPYCGTRFRTEGGKKKKKDQKYLTIPYCSTKGGGAYQQMISTPIMIFAKAPKKRRREWRALDRLFCAKSRGGRKLSYPAPKRKKGRGSHILAFIPTAGKRKESRHRRPLPQVHHRHRGRKEERKGKPQRPIATKLAD